MNLKSTLLFAALTYLGIVIIFINPSQAPAESGRKSDQNDLNIVPLPLPLASSVLGNGGAAVLIVTRNHHAYRPHHYRAVFMAAHTDRGLEAFNGLFDIQRPFDLPFRLTVAGLYMRNPVFAYYGRGNYQDMRKNEKIVSGEKPAGLNVPSSPDIMQFDEFSLNRNFIEKPGTAGGINPGRRQLRESQNRYFQYDGIKRGAAAFISDRIGKTPFKFRAGLMFNRYEILSYAGDRENGDGTPNIGTLVDLERPTGHDDINGTANINTAVGIIAYDTRPVDREANPDRGVYSGLKLETTGRGLGSDYTYQRWTLFHHQYVRLFDNYFKKQGRALVFAYRLFSMRTFEDVPFFEERGLGGILLRCYPSRQFVDRVMTAGSVELRWTFASVKLFGVTDFALLAFSDWGRVAPLFEKLSTRGIHGGAGLGLNMVVRKNAVIELIVGRSRYERFFSINVGHTFLMR